MKTSGSVIDVVVDTAARIQRQLDLGKVTEGEAVNGLMSTIWDRLTGRFGIESVGELPQAGRLAAAELREPLLVAALWQALRSWIPQSLAAEGRNATSAQQELMDEVSNELRAATEAAVTAVLESGAGGAADYTLLADAGLSERLARRVSAAFPPTRQTPSSSDQMWLKNRVLARFVRDGRYLEAVGEAGALTTAAQRAAATVAIVRAHFRDPLPPEPLPDLVVDLIRSTDWRDAPDHLDAVTSTMLRCHRNLVPAILRRWAEAGTHERTDDGRPYRRVASAIAWVAGDRDLALSVALRDGAPLGPRDVSDVNPAADYVLGQVAAGVDERVDRLLRFAHQVNGTVFERALVDAASTLLAGGEPVEAACLFTLSNWFNGGRGLPGIGVATDPWFTGVFTVDRDEKVSLLRMLHSAGVSGDIRFDGLRFDGAFDGSDYSPGSYYCPGSVATLRRVVAPLRAQAGIS